MLRVEAGPTAGAIRAIPRQVRLPASTAGLLLPWALALLACVVLGTLSVARIATYHAGKVDLDIQGQVIWNTGHGHPFASTILSDNDTHLAEHLAMSFAPLGALYAVVPDMRLLAVIQAFALAGSSVAVFLYARERLAGVLAPACVQAAYLAAPALAATAFQDFHPIALAVAPLAFGASLWLGGRSVPGVALCILAVAVEEEAALPLVGLGLLLALRGQVRPGLVTSVASLVFLIATTQVVMPSFQYPVDGAGGPNRAQAHYSQLRADPLAVTRLMGPERLADAARFLLLPTGSLPLLSPASLLPAAPTFVALILQDEDLERRYRQHWVATLLPFLGFATADGLRRFRDLSGTLTPALLVLVAGAAFEYWSASPLPGGGGYARGAFTWSPRSQAVADTLAHLPADQPVLTSVTLTAYANERHQVHIYPPDTYYAAGRPAHAAEAPFTLIDLGDPKSRAGFQQHAATLLGGGQPRTVFSAGQGVLLLADGALPPAQRPPRPALFGDRVRLEGMDARRVPNALLLTLYWQAERQVPSNARRSIELLAPGGASILSWSDRLFLWDLPGADWPAGLRVVEQVRVPVLDGQAVPTLRLAWRDPAAAGGPSGQWPLADGTGALDVPMPAELRQGSG